MQPLDGAMEIGLFHSAYVPRMLTEWASTCLCLLSLVVYIRGQCQQHFQDERVSWCFCPEVAHGKRFLRGVRSQSCTATGRGPSE